MDDSRLQAFRSPPRALAAVVLIAWFTFLSIGGRHAEFGDWVTIPLPNSLAVDVIALAAVLKVQFVGWQLDALFPVLNLASCALALWILSRGSLVRRLVVMAAIYAPASMVLEAVNYVMLMNLMFGGAPKH